MNDLKTVIINVKLKPRLTNITLSFDGESLKGTCVQQKCEIDDAWLDEVSRDQAEKTGLAFEDVRSLLKYKVEQHLQEVEQAQ
jgi:hypothetical protein